MSTASAPAPLSFTVLRSGSCQAAIVLCAWCPCQDLCCFITRTPADDEYSSPEWQLHIHRINWQLLCTVDLDFCDSDEEQVTQCVWRPDGLAIALGTSTGALHLLSTEERKIVRSYQSGSLHSAPITHLQWIDCLNNKQQSNNDNDDEVIVDFNSRTLPMHCLDQSSSTINSSNTASQSRVTASNQAIQFDTTSIDATSFVSRAPFVPHDLLSDELPRLPEPPPSALQQHSASAQQNNSNTKDVRSIVQDCTLTLAPTLLLSVDSAGRINALLCGTQHCMQLQCGQNADANTTSTATRQIHDLSLAPDLSSLVATSHIATPNGNTSIALHQFSLQHSLHARYNELHWLTWHTQRCEHLVNYIRTACHACCTQRWNAIRKALQFKFGALPELMYDELLLSRTEHSARSEWMQLLLCGIPSRAMYQLMTRYLTVSQLHKLASTCDKHLQAMQQGLNECVLAACDELMLRTEQLLGLAQWHERNAVLGLDASVLQCVIATMQQLHTVNYALLQSLIRTRHCLASFFDWLVSVVYRVVGDESQSDEQAPIAHYDGPFDTEACVECIQTLIDDEGQDPIARLISGTGMQESADEHRPVKVLMNGIDFSSLVAIDPALDAMSQSALIDRCSELAKTFMSLPAKTLSSHCVAAPDCIILQSNNAPLSSLRSSVIWSPASKSHLAAWSDANKSSIQVSRHSLASRAFAQSKPEFEHHQVSTLTLGSAPASIVSQLRFLDDHQLACISTTPIEASHTLVSDGSASALHIFNLDSDYSQTRVFSGLNIRHCAFGAQRGVAAILLRQTQSLEPQSLAEVELDSSSRRCLLLDLREDEDAQEDETEESETNGDEDAPAVQSDDVSLDE